MRKTSFFVVVTTAFILAMGVGGWTAMTATDVKAAGKLKYRRFPRARPNPRRPLRHAAGVLEPPLFPFQPLAQQPHVAPVRAPQHVEGVADQRHRAEHTIDGDVAEHAYDDVARRAQLVGLVHDEQRQRRGDEVADGGKSPISASRPKRTPVPGMTSAVSSSVASASIRAMRARRERGCTKSEPKA